MGVNRTIGPTLIKFYCYGDVHIMLFFFSLQLSLLGTLCSLLVKHVDVDSTRDTLIELLKETAKSYLRAQKTAPNQKQVK